MHCEKAETLLAQMVFGELDAASGEDAELSAHLAGCKACAEILNDMRVAAGLVREGLQAGPAPVLSPERRAALLAKAAEIRARPRAAGRRASVLSGRGRVIGGVAAAAAAVLLAGVLLSTGTLFRARNSLSPSRYAADAAAAGSRYSNTSDRLKSERESCIIRDGGGRVIASDRDSDTSGEYESDLRLKRDIFKSDRTVRPPESLPALPPPDFPGPSFKLKPEEAKRLNIYPTESSKERGRRGPAGPPPPPSDVFAYELREKLDAEPKPAKRTEKPPSDPSARRADGKPDDLDHYEPTEIYKDMDPRTSRGREEAIEDVPLGGTGATGSIGVGGGGSSRLEKSAEKLKRSEEDKKKSLPFSAMTTSRISSPQSPGEARKDEADAAARLTSPHALAALELIESRKAPEGGKAPPVEGETAGRAPFIVLTTDDEALSPDAAPAGDPNRARQDLSELQRVRQDLNRARQNLNELHRDRKNIAEELASAEYIIKRAVEEGLPIYTVAGTGPEVPDVSTKVLAVKPVTGYVALGAGSKAGIREGTVFLIHRGEKYIGKVRVKVVWDEFCGGTIIERREPIQVTDGAMTTEAGSPAPAKAAGTATSQELTSPHALAALELIESRKAPEGGKAPPVEGETAGRAPYIVLTPDEVKTVEKEQEQQAKLLEPITEGPPGVGHQREIEAPISPGAVFKVVPVNPFVMAAQDRFSTFGLDVDTASYAIARRYIRGGYLPPIGSVRMEEFVNAFDYNYPRQASGTFSVISEAAAAPFGQDLVLLKVGIRGRVVGREGRKPAHLVFVVDASGSMDQPDRMPLVKYALGELVGQLSPADRVSLVAYGTKARLMLEAASATDKPAIAAAIDRVQCEGSTNLSEGLTLGYGLAARSFIPGGVNRVILCSDGAANIGITAAEGILDQVKGFRDQGITCTSVGFGAGTYNDALLEKLANSGDGSYVFVDSRREARRIFVEELSATLQTIAKDAKIQVEFDPRRVRRYRLIGYENRDIADEKFRDDTVDAGEVGSGQSATALYEVELQGNPDVDLGTVYIRYRNVDTGQVEEISRRLEASAVRARTPESDPRFLLAACAAEFAEQLRESEHAAGGSFDQLRSVLEQVAAQPALRNDSRVQELLELVRLAKGLPRAN